MKKLQSLVLLAAAVTPVVVLAQSPGAVANPNLPATPAELINYAAWALVATLVPVLVSVIKVWFPKLEKSYSHTFPVIAMVLGAVLVWLINQLTTLHVAGVLGVFLGAAGVGLREVYDQTKSVWPTPPVMPTISVPTIWQQTSVANGGAGYNAGPTAVIPLAPTGPVAPPNVSPGVVTPVTPGK